MPQRRSLSDSCGVCGCFLVRCSLGFNYCEFCDGDLKWCDNCFHCNFYWYWMMNMRLENIETERVGIHYLVGLERWLLSFWHGTLFQVSCDRDDCCNLCKQCHELFSTIDNDWRYVWPTFFGICLCFKKMNDVLKKCGSIYWFNGIFSGLMNLSQ